MMYGGQRTPMQQGWANNMRQPMMPGGFRAGMPPYNAMMGTMPAPRPEFNQAQNRGGQRPSNNTAAPQRAPQSQVTQQARAAPATMFKAQPKKRDANATTALTSEMLAQANPSQQKQMIGERIFPKIQHREPKLAGKITGMLLEMDNMELLHLLEDEKALMLKINEALAVLNSHSMEPTEAAAE